MKFWDIISYNRGKGPSDGNNYWKKVTVPHYIYIGVMLTLMGLAIGLVSLFVCSAFLNMQGWEMFLSYLHEPLILALNLIPPLLVVYFFYFLTGRAWAGFTGSAFITFALSLIDYYKLRLRSEAFLASDISLARDAAGIISRYTLEITGRVLLVVFGFVFGIVFALLFMKGKLKNRWVRLIGAVLTLALLLGLGFTVYQDSRVYGKATNNSAQYNRWSDMQIFVSKGFVYPFINSIHSAIPHAPANYSVQEAQTVLAQYETAHIPADKRVNVISIMLEAYTDLSERPQVPVYDEVYAPLHALEAESLHGHIISNVFGGGTVNTERNFLTGYPNSEDYRRYTNSFVWYLREEGYYAEGLHPGDSWFYNRKNVERNLGMQNYYFLEDYNSEDRSDSFFFTHLRELYGGRDKATPYFSFNVTYQNHGPYASTGSGEKAYLEREGLSDASFHILNNYLRGVADTSKKLAALVEELRADPEPVVLVFFGDHMPWLGDGNSVYTELGISLDLSTDEGLRNYYSTPYVIWANDAAKAVTGGSFTGEGGDLSSCFLMSLLFDECGWTGDDYMQFNRSVRDSVPIVNMGSYIYEVNGQLTKNPDGEILELIRRFFRVEYYMKHSFRYSAFVQ